MTSFQHRYIDVLLAEIQSFNIEDDSLDTIYIGGGTPTSLDDSLLEKLLSYLADHFHNIKEFTIETNPENITTSKAKILSKYGINRVSIGVQTTDKNLLNMLGRDHSKDDVTQAIERLKNVGIENINLDFIYGIPNMTIDALDKDIDFALAQDIKHLSFYSLQIEEGTKLYISGYKEEDENTLRKMYDHIKKRLKENGFNRYEVSNFAKIGYQSLHNLSYWRNLKYYGVGLGAAGYIFNTRYKNTLSLTRYLKKDYNRVIEKIDKQSDEFYFLMLGLRLDEGISLIDYKKRYHKDFINEYKDQLDEIEDYIDLKDDKFKIKEEYLYTMDDILLKLLHFVN